MPVVHRLARIALGGLGQADERLRRQALLRRGLAGGLLGVVLVGFGLVLALFLVLVDDLDLGPGAGFSLFRLAVLLLALLLVFLAGFAFLLVVLLALAVLLRLGHGLDDGRDGLTKRQRHRGWDRLGDRRGDRGLDRLGVRGQGGRGHRRLDEGQAVAHGLAERDQRLHGPGVAGQLRAEFLGRPLHARLRGMPRVLALH